MAENSSAARWFTTCSAHARGRRVHWYVFDPARRRSDRGMLERPDVKGLGDKPTAANLHVEGGAILGDRQRRRSAVANTEPRADTLGTSNGSS